MAAKNFYPVILAGGRGTRFWPLSRKRRAKQVLALDGKRTMVQQTVARLEPLASLKQFWVITNDDLRDVIRGQAPKLRPEHVIAEPAANGPVATHDNGLAHDATPLLQIDSSRLHAKLK